LIVSNLLFTGTQPSNAWVVYRGALRETGTNDADSAAGRTVTLRGGVLEIDGALYPASAPFARMASSAGGPGTLSWGPGGGGFAAFRQDAYVMVSNGTQATVVNVVGYQAPGGAVNFAAIPNATPLVLGSPSADATVHLLDDFWFGTPGTGTAVDRQLKAIRGPNASVPAGIVEGQIYGAAPDTNKRFRIFGDGTVILAHTNNTYGPYTVVDGATVLVNGRIAPVSPSTVTVTNGGTLGGTGAVQRAVIVADGAHLAPGSYGIGTLTVSNLTLASNALLDFDLGAPGNGDRVAVMGTLTLAGRLNVTGRPGFTSGTHTLITYSGALTNNGLAIGVLPGGFNGRISTYRPGQVELVIQPAAMLIVR
jgi:hypothetical protein